VALRRIFAYVVDLAILLGLSFAAWWALVLAGLLSFGLVWPLIPLALALLPLAYHGLLVGGPRSATVGMGLCGLEVRGWTGQRPTVWQGLLMAALFYATIGPTCGLVLLVALFNDRRRTLHDFLSGTVVVRRLPAGVIRPGA